MTTKTFDIHERIFNFIVDVVNFLNKLPKTPTNLIFINQCTRSSTSIGANGQEADGANSKKDFIHGLTVVRKEGKETTFWLRLISKTNPNYSIEADQLVNEGKEITAIISKIITNTSNNKQ